MWGICNTTWLLQSPTRIDLSVVSPTTTKAHFSEALSIDKRIKYTGGRNFYWTYHLTYFLLYRLNSFCGSVFVGFTWRVGLGTLCLTDWWDNWELCCFRCGLPLSSFMYPPAYLDGCLPELVHGWQQKNATIHYIVHFWFLRGTSWSQVPFSCTIKLQLLLIVSSATTAKDDDDNIIPFMPRDSSRAVALYLCLRDNHVLFMGI